MPNHCPCCSGKEFHACCQPYLLEEILPETPEQLMRSRYSAYSMADIDYIEKTMRGPALQNFDSNEAKQWASSVKWQGLEVLASTQKNDQGTANFIASFQGEGELRRMQENSLFHRIHGVWYYIDSVKSEKIGRNQLCSCGSGKKYKHCCMR